jgi:hypothetical protein
MHLSFVRMDESSTTQNRRSRRSNLLMAASLEHAGGVAPVTLRNLSADGALVEGEHGLAVDTPILFRRKELAVSGRIAWIAGKRAGIAFDMALDPETVRRHVPAPKARSEKICKRPGFHGPMSPAEKRFAETVWDQPLPSIEK